MLLQTQTKIYSHNWGEGKNLDNCPFCGKLPILNAAPLKMQPILSCLYMGIAFESDWACPSCGSIFDKDNNLLVMGKINGWDE